MACGQWDDAIGLSTGQFGSGLNHIEVDQWNNIFFHFDRWFNDIRRVSSRAEPSFRFRFQFYSASAIGKPIQRQQTTDCSVAQRVVIKNEQCLQPANLERVSVLLEQIDSGHPTVWIVVVQAIRLE